MQAAEAGGGRVGRWCGDRLRCARRGGENVEVNLGWCCGYRYGRSSLRSELMVQIMGGVGAHMERLADEEVLIKAGEKSRDRSPGSHDKSVPIDKAHRDHAIEAWLIKRRGDSPNPNTNPNPKPEERQKARSAPLKPSPTKSAPSLFHGEGKPTPFHTHTSPPHTRTFHP